MIRIGDKKWRLVVTFEFDGDDDMAEALRSTSIDQMGPPGSGLKILGQGPVSAQLVEVGTWRLEPS